MNNYSTIKKVYRPQISPDAPYGVEILVDVSDKDEAQGASEMSWYKTKEEQNAYFEEARTDIEKLPNFISSTNTIGNLTREYQAWLKSHDYPALSADELLAEVHMTEGTEAHESEEEYLVTGFDRQYLQNFLERWERAEAN